MKKALSLILAVIMVAAMLPSAAFAAEGGSSSDAGITIKYDLAKYISELGAIWESTPKISFTKLSYELTDGFFQYADSSSSTGDTLGSNLNWNSGFIQMASGRNIAFEVFIPKAGTYTMNMYNALRGDNSTTTSVYLTKAGVEVDADTPIIGEYNCFDETLTGQNKFSLLTTPNVLENAVVVDEPGYYRFTFKANSSYGSVGTFELVLGDGTGSALTGAVTKQSRIMAKGAELQFDLALYMNNGSVAEKEYDVLYESSNSSVASVSDSGLITAVADGNAVITASVENENGYVLEAKKNITVTGAGVTVFYDIIGYKNKLGLTENKEVAPPFLTVIDYEATNDFFDYVGTNHTYDGWEPTGSGNAIRYSSNQIQLRKNKYLAFEFNIPEAGTYDLQITAPQNKDKRWMGPMNVYVSQGSASTNASDFVGSYAFYNETVTTSTTKIIEDISIGTEGKYVFTFCVASENPDPETSDCYQYIGSVKLVGGTNNAIMGGSITSTASMLTADETATVTAEGYLSSTAEAAAFTYSSSNTSVAAVDAESGVVTPVAPGKATISATCADAKVNNVLTTDITVITDDAGEYVEDTMVSVGISPNNSDYGSITTSLGAVVDEVKIGTSVSATAVPNEGYEFAYWENSAGQWLSSSATETFVANVNTGITAVFEAIAAEDAATVPVSFFNGNGVFMNKADATKGVTVFKDIKPTTEPKLTGFAFDKWNIGDDEVITAASRAVALYKASGEGYTVTEADGDNQTTHADKKYDEKVTVTADGENFKCWLLGDIPVSYERSYSFHVWGDITLTAQYGADVEKLPTIALTKTNGEFFTVYNVPAGYTLIETGILFSETSEKPGIAGFHSKATAKKNSGQFTAKPDEESGENPIARGYLLVKNNATEEYRVIYAD